MKRTGIYCVILMISAIILLLIAPPAAHAIGLKTSGPHRLTCDVTTQAVAGTYIYWRAVGGAFTDANRAQTGDIARTPFDTLTVIKKTGTYEFAAAYYDAAGNESDPSNVVVIPFVLLTAPANAKVVE